MWPCIIVVGVLHVASFLANLTAALTEQGTSLTAIVMTALWILAWVGVGVLMGWLRRPKFVLWVVLFWLVAVLVYVIALTVIIEPIEAVAVAFCAPCYPIISILPMTVESAVFVAMALVCFVSLVAYAISRTLSRAFRR